MRVEELETPAVTVDLDVVERNLDRMAAYCREHRLGLRPHTKTHKVPAIAEMQRSRGALGITVAKVGEAEVMADAGQDDILVHYPVMGDSKLDRLGRIALKNKVTVALDSVTAAESVAHAAVKTNSHFDVLLEVDTGMHRCGISTPEEAERIVGVIAQLSGLQFVGLTTYPGHIRQSLEQQAEALKAVGEQLNSICLHLEKSGYPVKIVSGGSTPTACNSHLTGSLTEIRPGTYVFNDRNTVSSGACTWDDCALRVRVTVVSAAVKGQAVIDGGSKTFTSDRSVTNDGYHGRVIEHPEVKFASMSEEHGVLQLEDSGWTPRVGEQVTVIPNHVCVCVNLHDTLHYHRNGEIQGQWAVAGRGKVR